MNLQALTITTKKLKSWDEILRWWSVVSNMVAGRRNGKLPTARRWLFYIVLIMAVEGITDSTSSTVTFVVVLIGGSSPSGIHNINFNKILICCNQWYRISETNVYFKINDAKMHDVTTFIILLFIILGMFKNYPDKCYYS